MPEDQRQQTPAALIDLLCRGEMEVEGRLANSSNYTFLVQLTLGDSQCRAVYKPGEGENVLSDFPPQLYRREVAAYELSKSLGWPNIPPTVIRDGRFGEGSVQLFVDADFSLHYFTHLENPDLHPQLVEIAAFDIVANNTDRKAGHCLLVNETIYAIDNGLCFHEEEKLRTVVWDFAGTALSDQQVDRLLAAAESPPRELFDLLDAAEVDALISRLRSLAAHPVLPEPVSQYQFPWPLF